jgi:hypothetical protein
MSDFTKHKKKKEHKVAVVNQQISQEKYGAVMVLVLERLKHLETILQNEKNITNAMLLVQKRIDEYNHKVEPHHPHKKIDMEKVNKGIELLKTEARGNKKKLAVISDLEQIVKHEEAHHSRS